MRRRAKLVPEERLDLRAMWSHVTFSDDNGSSTQGRPIFEIVSDFNLIDTDSELPELWTLGPQFAQGRKKCVAPRHHRVRMGGPEANHRCAPEILTTYLRA
jgi:hypothetical protein